MARRDGDGDVEAPPEPPPAAAAGDDEGGAAPPAALAAGGDGAAPALLRSPPVNPALVRAQRAEETLQLKLEVRPATTQLACSRLLGLDEDVLARSF